MNFRPRSLVQNSLGSLLASGTLIIATVLIPAIAARAFTRSELDIFLSALALLPLLLILPQSHRTVVATQLNHLLASGKRDQVLSTFVRFTLITGIVQLLLGVAGIEIYTAIYGAKQIGTEMLRTGLYCLLAYSLGILAISLVVAPAAAHRDFRPDNVAKLSPGLLQVAGLLVVWQLGFLEPMPLAFGVYPASAWPVALALVLWVGFPYLHRAASDPVASSQCLSFLAKGLGGITWWNLTAFLATTAAISIIALRHPESLAPFSLAVSLLGLVSAGLIAVSGPVAVQSTSLRDADCVTRRRFFLTVNTLFQGYILIAALIVALMPVPLYELWLNADLAADVKRFAILLLPASLLRLLTMAFTIFVMAAGRQHTLWFSPLAEALASVTGALILGTYFGAEGVAIALTMSAALRLLLTLGYDSRKNHDALGFGATDVLLPAWGLVRAARC